MPQLSGGQTKIWIMAYTMRLRGIGTPFERHDYDVGLEVVQGEETRFVVGWSLGRDVVDDALAMAKRRGLEPPPAKTLVLLCGVALIESRLRLGTLPDADTNGVVRVRADDIDYEALLRLGTEKRCAFRLNEGRESFCSAGAVVSDVATAGSLDDRERGHRRVIITSRPTCASCEVADDRLLCSHLMHVEVKTAYDKGGNHRAIVEKRCDMNREEVGRAAGCRLGEHECAERLVMVDGSTAPTIPPPLALHEALDSMAMAWRVVFGATLFRPRSVVQVGGLTQDCGCREEFESRLSALADLIKQFEVDGQMIHEKDKPELVDKPEGRSRTWDRFVSAIRRHVDEGGADPATFTRVQAAVKALRGIGGIRNTIQHTGGDATKEWARLGLSYPPASWADAWCDVRRQVIEKLRIVRDELLTLST